MPDVAVYFIFHLKMEILIALQKKKITEIKLFQLQNQKTMVDPIQRKQELTELDGHLMFMNKC